MKGKYIPVTVLIYIIFGYFVFGNSLNNGFIWDDELQIVNNPYIHSISKIPLFFRSSTFYYSYEDRLIGMFYRPIMMSTYSLIYYFFGLNSWWFHFVQIFMHIANSYLVYLILRRLSNKTPEYIAALLGLVFMVHPAQSEVVSYAANLQDVLFFFFGSIAFLITVSGKIYRVRFVAILMLLVLSIFSKETGVLFITITGIYIYFFDKKIIMRYVTACAVIVLFYMYMRCGVAGICSPGSQPNPIGELPFMKFLLQIPALSFYYLKLIIYPVEPAAGQDWVVRRIGWGSFYLPLLITSLTFFGSFYTMLKLAVSKKADFKIYTLFLLWFLIGILFHLHIIPLDFTVADRWLYFSFAGWVCLVGVILSHGSSRQLKVFTVLLIIVSVLFSVRTHIRNRDWKDNFTLFSRDVLKSERSFHFENNLGVEYYRQGNTEEAEKHFIRSLSYAPNWYTPRLNLCIIYHSRGRLEAAKSCYEDVIRIVKSSRNPHIKQPHINYQVVVEEIERSKR